VEYTTDKLCGIGLYYRSLESVNQSKSSFFDSWSFIFMFTSHHYWTVFFAGLIHSKSSLHIFFNIRVPVDFTFLLSFTVLYTVLMRCFWFQIFYPLGTPGL